MVTNVGLFSGSYARYAFETTFGTAIADGSLTTYFGHNVKFNRTIKNNIERIPDLNTRNYTKFGAKKVEGTWGADFQVSNFSFMKGVLGSVADAGSGPYTHTYSEANVPPSLTIQASEDLDTDSEQTLTGCLIDKFSMNLNVGEIVKGKLDGTYIKEVKDSTLNTNGNSQDAEDVFSFSHGTIELPTSTTIGEIQSCDVSISNNAELIWGLGSRFATQRAFKQRVYEFKINKIREQDSDFLDKLYGSTTTMSSANKPADTATLNLTLTNGLGTTLLRSFTMKVDSLQVDDFSSTLSPGDLTKEDVTLYALGLNSSSKAVYTNNTATSP